MTLGSRINGTIPIIGCIGAAAFLSPVSINFVKSLVASFERSCRSIGGQQTMPTLRARSRAVGTFGTCRRRITPSRPLPSPWTVCCLLHVVLLAVRSFSQRLFPCVRRLSTCAPHTFCTICFVQTITLLRIFRLDISSALPTSVRTVLSSKDCSSMNLSVRSCRANKEKILQNYLRTHWRQSSLQLKQILGPFDGRPCKVFPHALGERHPSQPVRNMCWRTFPHVPSYRNSKRVTF